jgi:hypothetical protein
VPFFKGRRQRLPRRHRSRPSPMVFAPVPQVLCRVGRSRPAERARVQTCQSATPSHQRKYGSSRRLSRPRSAGPRAHRRCVPIGRVGIGSRRADGQSSWREVTERRGSSSSGTFPLPGWCIRGRR